MQREVMLGIDFGERRIGVAVSDGAIAVPLRIVEHQNRAKDLDRIAGIAAERRAQTIVVGLPLLMSGDEGEQARRTRRFGDALARRVAVPVVYHDESLSSFAASDASPETVRAHAPRTAIDDRAAAIILQSYIDAHAESRVTSREASA